MVDVKQIFIARYPQFYQQHHVLALGLIAFIRVLWQEKTLKDFAASDTQSLGADYVSSGFRYLNFTLAVDDAQRSNIPATGPLIIVANHPIGSLDGVGLLKLVAESRGDTKILANAILFQVEQMQNVLIPIDNLGGGADRKAIAAINQHLKSAGALALFPAGKVSRIYHGKIQDDVWSNAFIKLALKHQAAIVPVYFEARNSYFFYLLSKLCMPLSTLWLIREIYRFKNKTVSVKIGAAINIAPLVAGKSVDQLALMVRDRVYALKGKHDGHSNV